MTICPCKKLFQATALILDYSYTYLPVSFMTSPKAFM